MKHTAVRRILAVTALVLFSMTALASAASAQGGSISFDEWKDRLLNVQSFKFQRHKDGIGLGRVPVYTAPSGDALRLDNGHAACDTGADMYEGGYTPDGWLLVRYAGRAATHVGYVPPKYTSKAGFKSSMTQKRFDSLSAVAAEAIPVTDNPLKQDSSFGTLEAGDSFRILAKYTYNGSWWYIEFTAEGQPARGFIDRTASFFRPGEDVEGGAEQEALNLETLGIPDHSPDGAEQAGEILINGTEKDERKRVHKDSALDSKWISVVYPTRRYPCYGTRTDGQRTFYYIFVEEDSAWGWVASDYCTFTEK